MSFGPYEPVQELGRGGMGQVYRARHRETGLQVALKTVTVPHEGLLQGLRREIKGLARLRHPGIVRILDDGVHEGRPWYAMELLEGPTLRSWWAEQAGSSQALTVAHGLCAPLAYLHGEGLVHRDLKPDNVLVRYTTPNARHPRPVLVDFGLAGRFAGAAGREELTLGGELSGTAAYMAPEQVEGQLVDARADLYALGCILYESFCGRPPFVGRSAMEVLVQHLEAEPLPPSKHIEGLPVGLDDVVLRLLEKEPRRRFGHADDVALALERLGAEAVPGLEAPRPRAYLYRPGFCGRKEVFESLLESISEMQDTGRGSMVLVAGESGVGKTRLLTELASAASRRRLLVLGGECVPGGAESGPEEPSGSGQDSDPGLGLDSTELRSGERSARAPSLRSDRSPVFAAAAGPLWALRKPLQAIADRCRERGEVESERLLGRRGKLLAQYEPALSGLPGQERHAEPVELPTNAARTRLFADLAETFEALAQDEPLLLVLDDLQWADELTMGFLEFWRAAQQRQRSVPVQVVCAFRTDYVGTQRAESVSRLIEAAGVVSIGLRRLDEVAVGAMARDMLALPATSELFSRHLARHSEGNPFFVAEYLRTALDEGLLWRDGLGRWQVAEAGEAAATEATYATLPLPTSLRELVGRRLAGLPELARRLVQAAAVLGREFQPALVLGMTGLEEVDASKALSELLRRQILEEPRLEPGPTAPPDLALDTRHTLLRFVHDKIREVAYGDIPPERRGELHRAAAETVESVYAADLAPHQAALARHWEGAGQLDKAGACSLAAAFHAKNRSSSSEAERLALACIRLSEGHGRRSAEAHGLLADLFLNRGANLDAMKTARLAVEQASALGDAHLETAARRPLATALMRLGRLEEAQQASEHFLRSSRELGLRRSEAVALRCLGQVLVHLGKRADAMAAYEESLTISRELSDTRFEALTLHYIVEILYEQGHVEQALKTEQQALRSFQEGGHLSDVWMALQTLGILFDAMGRWAEAWECLEQALALARRLGNPVGGILSESAAALVRQGRLEEARARGHQALDAMAGGRPRFEAITHRRLGEIYHHLGQPDAAEAHFQTALRLAREVGTPDLVADVLCSHAAVWRWSGRDLDSIDALLQEAQAALDTAPAPGTLLVLFCQHGRLSLARLRNGRDWLSRIEAVYEQAGLRPEPWAAFQIDALRRAVEAYEAGDHDRLSRGELSEDFEEASRRYLR